MVGGHRGHPAPVVDTGGEKRSQLVGEVGWGLEVDVGREDDAGGGDGPRQLLGGARRCTVHGRARLGQEVLDDDLLHVAVAAVAVGDGRQRDQTVSPRLADPDQESGGEGDLSLSGRLQGGQAALGGLVGGRAVGGEVGVE